jgi:hypothetical protein
MSSTVEPAVEIRSFRVEVPQEELDDLRGRIQATRRPGYGFSEKPSTTGWDPVHIARAWIALYQAPRSWAEEAYPNLIYYNKVGEGNHFAAWQEPELFTSELRAAFRSLRDEGRSS